MIRFASHLGEESCDLAFAQEVVLGRELRSQTYNLKSLKADLKEMK